METVRHARGIPVAFPGPSRASPRAFPGHSRETEPNAADDTEFVRAYPWLCLSCDERSREWLAECPFCGTSKQMMHRPPGHVETRPPPKRTNERDADGAVEPGLVAPRKYTYVSTGYPALDEALNGGLADGTVTLIGGPSGAGKTSVVLCMFQNMTGVDGYATAEQSEDQVVGAAQRIGATRRGLFVKETKDLDEALAYFAKRRVKAGCLDSLNRFRIKGINADRGSPKMCAAIIERCLEWAREHDAILILISHFTKDGDFAGRSDVQHDVDLTVKLRKFRGGIRRLDVVKSRIGPDENRWARFTTTRDGAFVEAPLVAPPAPVHSDPRAEPRPPPSTPDRVAPRTDERRAGRGSVDDPGHDDGGRADGPARRHRPRRRA